MAQVQSHRATELVGGTGASCIQGQVVTEAFYENIAHIWRYLRSTAKIVLGQVVTIVLGLVVTTVTTLGRLVPMAQQASCVPIVTERKKII